MKEKEMENKAKDEERFDLKVANATHRIEELYYQSNGQCYISFSGGKDSTVLLGLVKLSVEVGALPIDGIKAVFCDTGVELQATRDFVEWCKKCWCPNIEIIRPKKSFGQVLKENGKPIKSKIKSEFMNRYQVNDNMNSFGYLINGFNQATGKQFHKTKIGDKDLHILSKDFPIIASSKCCDYLKKKPFSDYNKQHDIDGYIIGIRSNEGGARELSMLKRLANGGKICTYVKDGRIVKAPIIDWTDEDIDMFIERYDVPLSKAYTKYGMTRTGCMGCPYSRDLKNNLEVLYRYEPNRYKASMFYLKDVYIAQNIKLPFDEQYENERKEKWIEDGGYFDMRLEMIKKYRPEKIKASYTDKNKFK